MVAEFFMTIADQAQRYSLSSFILLLAEERQRLLKLGKRNACAPSEYNWRA